MTSERRARATPGRCLPTAASQRLRRACRAAVGFCGRVFRRVCRGVSRHVGHRDRDARRALLRVRCSPWRRVATGLSGGVTIAGTRGRNCRRGIRRGGRDGVARSAVRPRLCRRNGRRADRFTPRGWGASVTLLPGVRSRMRDQSTCVRNADDVATRRGVARERRGKRSRDGERRRNRRIARSVRSLATFRVRLFEVGDDRIVVVGDFDVAVGHRRNAGHAEEFFNNGPRRMIARDIDDFIVQAAYRSSLRGRVRSTGTTRLDRGRYSYRSLRRLRGRRRTGPSVTAGPCPPLYNGASSEESWGPQRFGTIAPWRSRWRRR